MNEWLIWSIEHGAWWRAGEMGYTASVRDAGRYTADRAEAIVAHANIAAFHECMIPVAAVRAFPTSVPETLVWRSEGSRLWTGVMWIDCSDANLADVLVEAHNGVLSGLFGAAALREIKS